MAVWTRNTQITCGQVSEQTIFSGHFFKISVLSTQVVEETRARGKCTGQGEGSRYLKCYTFADGNGTGISVNTDQAQDVSQVSRVCCNVRLQDRNFPVVAFDQAEQYGVLIGTSLGLISNCRSICTGLTGKVCQGRIRRRDECVVITLERVESRVQPINVTFPTALCIHCDWNSLHCYVPEGSVSGTCIHFDFEVQSCERPINVS